MSSTDVYHIDITQKYVSVKQFETDNILFTTSRTLLGNKLSLTNADTEEVYSIELYQKNLFGFGKNELIVSGFDKPLIVTYGFSFKKFKFHLHDTVNETDIVHVRNYSYAIRKYNEDLATFSFLFSDEFFPKTSTIRIYRYNDNLSILTIVIYCLCLIEVKDMNNTAGD
jgi:hypothetical protein